MPHRNQIAHERLNSWASWLQLEDSSALGVRIVDYNADRSGGTPKAIVPDVFRSPEIVLTERAVQEQSLIVQMHIRCRYLLSPKDAHYIKLTRSQIAYMLKSIADYLCLK